jgi:RNA polymerase sigma-70 factor (ECF subfamily)
VNEPQLLEAARNGDEGAFGDLVEPYRAELHVHSYRMLGSVPDAEDAVQEALLGAWRGLRRFEGRSSLRSWLYKVVTNACLKVADRRPARVLPVDYGPAADPHDGPGEPLVESVWVEPFPDEAVGLADGLAAPDARYEQRESVELAFVAAFQLLPPRQRAVLLLRDVLGFSGQEVADALDTTPASVYSALQRAHATIDDRLPDRSQQATVRALGDDELRAIVEVFVEAWERGDVDAVVAMLTDDAVIAMPPMPTWFSGREAVAGFLAGWPLEHPGRWRVVPVSASGQLAFAHYMREGETQTFARHSITLLTLESARVKEITAFLNPEAFDHFDLPEMIRA